MIGYIPPLAAAPPRAGAPLAAPLAPPRAAPAAGLGSAAFFLSSSSFSLSCHHF